MGNGKPRLQDSLQESKVGKIHKEQLIHEAQNQPRVEDRYARRQFRDGTPYREAMGENRNAAFQDSETHKTMKTKPMTTIDTPYYPLEKRVCLKQSYRAMRKSIEVAIFPTIMGLIAQGEPTSFSAEFTREITAIKRKGIPAEYRDDFLKIRFYCKTPILPPPENKLPPPESK
jgi:hypothetical protein